MNVRRDTVAIYRDRDGEWRWRRTAPNGNIIADSAEGYNNRAFCEQMAKRVNKRAKFEVQP